MGVGVDVGAAVGVESGVALGVPLDVPVGEGIARTVARADFDGFALAVADGPVAGSEFADGESPGVVVGSGVEIAAW